MAAVSVSASVCVSVSVSVFVSVSVAAALLWALVPASMRVSASLLMSGIVFASFAPSGGRWAKARASAAAAINLILLALWRDLDRAPSPSHSPSPSSPFSSQTGGGGEGPSQGIAQDVLEWTRGLPTTTAKDKAKDKAKDVNRNKNGRFTLAFRPVDPEGQKEYAEARRRKLADDARDSALKRLDVDASKDASIGYRMLLMPLVIGAAAIVPIVIASRMLEERFSSSPHEGEEGEEGEGGQDGAEGEGDWDMQKSLLKAVTVSIVATALAAVLVRTGHLVLAWVLSISLLAFCTGCSGCL